MPEHLLFYTYRRAVILRYDAIKTISLKKDGDLLLETSSGDFTMPVRSGENGGIIFAVLRGKNPEIKQGTGEEAPQKETERT
ncbi:unknown [Eubacterium sp. CAG:786]|nr:unknown [Eubacterium sp. CAG:786]